MVKQDYMERMIHEMVRMLLGLLGADIRSPYEELAEELTNQDLLVRWQRLADDGKINEAENEVYEQLESGDKKTVQTAVYFYDYLNRKDDAFLQSCNYSRDEIEEGLKAVAARCGLESMLDI